MINPLTTKNRSTPIQPYLEETPVQLVPIVLREFYDPGSVVHNDEESGYCPQVLNSI